MELKLLPRTTLKVEMVEEIKVAYLLHRKKLLNNFGLQLVILMDQLYLLKEASVLKQKQKIMFIHLRILEQFSMVPQENIDIM